MAKKGIVPGKIALPHVYVLLVIIIMVAALFTWILPAGEFERGKNAAGRTVVIPGTYHTLERSPVGPFKAVKAVYDGMNEAADVVFFIFIAFAAVSILVSTGALHGAIAGLLKKLRGTARAATIPCVLVVIGIGSSTIGMSEETIAFIPIFAGLAIAMGYDAIVGMAMVVLATAIGYSGSAMNPFTVGIAQSIAEVPYLSGSFYRIICHAVMIAVASAYTIRYALKIQKDPTKSLVYGDDFSKVVMDDGTLETSEFGIKQKLSLFIFFVTVGVFVLGVTKWDWYFGEICAAFMVMMIVISIVMGWSPNEMMRHVTRSLGDITVAALTAGIARGILVVLREGRVIDTVIYYLSMPLSSFPTIVATELMLVVQTLLNFVIPSGSGQAAAIMPIMVPLADILGISRQTAILAYQFGDGLTNILWPTSKIVVIAALAGVKITKWWRWFLPLFFMLVGVQGIMLAIASAIGY